MRPLLLLLAACQVSGETDPVDTITDPPAETEDTDPPAVETDPPAPVETDPPVDPPVRVPTTSWTGSGVVTCLGPSLRTERRFDTSPTTVAGSEELFIAGAGLALVDLDDNGTFEIIVARQDSVDVFHRDVEPAWSEQLLYKDNTLRDGFFGVSAADYDGDWDLDVYVTSYPGGGTLLQNDGLGVLTDVTAEAGVGGPPGHHSSSSTWADLDRDGDLDLIVAGHGFVDEDGDTPIELFAGGDPTLLFFNNGDGTFTDGTAALPPEIADDYTFMVSVVDLNVDGWPDLYLGNDFAGRRDPSQAVLNVGGTFTKTGVDPALDVHIVGMGIGAGDVNGDGIPDLFLPGWSAIGFLVSNGGTWFEQSQTSGVTPNLNRDQQMGWGTEFGDMDNDGDMDVVASFGYLDTRFAPNDLTQPTALYLQESNGQYRDRAGDWGVADRDATRGLVLADINRDGWLDIARASVDDRVWTDESRCGDRTWLRVQLAQDGLNRYGIGAKIQLRSDGRTMTRWVMAGGTGYGSSGPPEVHFGLETDELVEQIQVTWPDGEMDVLYDIPTRQGILIPRSP